MEFYVLTSALLWRASSYPKTSLVVLGSALVIQSPPGLSVCLILFFVFPHPVSWSLDSDHLNFWFTSQPRAMVTVSFRIPGLYCTQSSLGVASISTFHFIFSIWRYPESMLSLQFNTWLTREKICIEVPKGDPLWWSIGLHHQEFGKCF